jgi:hypothetical protein
MRKSKVVDYNNGEDIVNAKQLVIVNGRLHN